MEPTSSIDTTASPATPASRPQGRTSLPSRIAGLCVEENASLTRPMGDGTVIPRAVDPHEKPRTAGARTAG